ncbi:amidohydrolase [Rhodohalobacter sp. SW132]|uniref:amidohydrolase n=1 Tax=Rhodohalobacter sp. SW132 TaxID=2293433 RepID=UPI000E258ABC|nr:amidohydrolase [Rhodohalobacter sp. SW132]REL33370.1 amidohydrolase [Rhodohalobacter sp. SW132]
MILRYLVFILPLLLIAGCSSGPQDGTVIHNINGYTIAGNELVQFEAIAFSGDEIVAIGTSSVITEDYENFEQIDGEGRTLLPGLIDAHAHVMGLGFQEMDVDVSGLRSLEETQEKLREYAEENPDLEWIRGRGWNQELWEENEFPTAADIDEVIADRPVWLTRVDGHAGWANTRAMEIAGISRETPDVQGGRIIRDARGDATGIFVDATMRNISANLPERTEEDNRQALTLALETMAEHGLTSVHDARTDVFTWEMYKDFADNGELKTRIYAMIAGMGEPFDVLSADGPVEEYADHKLSLRSVKISSDGALGSRGAAMIEEYSDEPENHGLLFYDQEEMNEMLLRGAENGFQMNIHAIGDAANRQVLDGFQYVNEQLGDQADMRHRIEHAQVVAPEDIPRFTELNLVASMQPTHATSDMNMAENRVGSDRIEGAYAWQTFLNQGTVIAGGSDFPVENVNPFYGLYSAVTRKDHDGRPPEGWYSEQAMSRVEALRAFTVDAAYAAHQEDVIGSLEQGKKADFILIDRDFFEVDASEIWQTEVLETWMGGERVFSRGDHQ